MPEAEASPRPQPKDLSDHFSEMAKLRVQSSVAPFLNALTPSVTNLGAAFPLAETFPADSLEGAIAKTNRFPLHPMSPSSFPSLDISRFAIPKFSSLVPAVIATDNRIDLATSLQYQDSMGLPALANFVHDFSINHQNQGKIPYSKPETLMTGGAVDAFSKCLSTFANPGDSILMEEVTYFTARDAVLPFELGVVPMELDDEGIDPVALGRILDTWNEKKRGRKPHMMYTVSLGQNPTGSITPLKKKKMIYRICQKHDILIFEDEPFWPFQYNIPEASTETFLASLAPSYLQIDIDGRVLGINTFTKVIAPGCRVGWIVAQPAFIEKLTFLTDNSTSNPSGFGESVLAQLFRQWGTHGFIRWIEGLRASYLQKRDVLCEALAEGRDLVVHSHHQNYNHSTAVEPTTQVYGNGSKRKRHSGENEHHHNRKTKIRMYEFEVPAAGFLIWVQINTASHPLSHSSRGKSKLTPSEIIQLLWKHLYGPPYNLLTVPGSVFAATPGVQEEIDAAGVGHLRLAFIGVETSELKRVGEVFGHAMKTFWEGEGWDLEALDADVAA
ncbi:pyridoxal phosphate-dependent transferase [Cadophora sp. MPI-SDFR-AT-0126]|nr:pyridoxal phosphate-dependent transferase [Leotiomycetes sp. MPI-SDFR-AT-0126]